MTSRGKKLGIFLNVFDVFLTQDENWELKCEKRTLLLDQEKQEASLKLALANARKKEQEVRTNSIVAANAL